MAAAEGDPPVLWTPLPGPQTLALDSPADELFFGGAGGGGKTDLIIGAAVTRHRVSIIFRRELSQFRGASGIIERSREIIGEAGHLNENLYVWRRIQGLRSLEFGGVQYEADVRRYRGRAHDLKAFDELPEFLESQYRFLIGWLRTVHPGQRTRVISTGNPPTTEEGAWVIQYWAPWLDPTHHRPALPGELRWFAVLDGADVEVSGPEPILHQGEQIRPRSRTFVPARVEDNPYYLATGYIDVLNSLPEPLRSQLRYGDFSAKVEGDPFQVIPTAWVLAAQQRWTETPPEGVPLTAVGNDPSRGGKDEFVIARRHGHWFAPLEAHPGARVPDGPTGAALLVRAVTNDPTVPVLIDIIGTAGSSVYDQARQLNLSVVAMNASEGTKARDHSGRLGFVNKRALWYWRMREALDPTSGLDVQLPPDPQLRADLCAPRWKVTLRGIQVESKDDIKARLGRSPDRGDAVIYANADESAGGFFEYVRAAVEGARTAPPEGPAS